MNLGVRSLLLIAAVVLFILSAIMDRGNDFIAFGLAAFAASFLVSDSGLGTRR